MLVDVTYAKELLVVKEDPQELLHKRPSVKAYNCRQCFVSNDDTNICLTYGGNSKIGWDWVQEYYDNPLTIGIKDGWYILGWEAYA